MLAAREMHRFQAAGRPFAYLVPSAAIFALDETAAAILDKLGEGPRPREVLVQQLGSRADPQQVEESLDELTRVRAVGPLRVALPLAPKQLPPQPFPLTTLVLNVTNQCNLACTYCYEYGEDRIVDTQDGRKPKFMTEETARASVDFMLKQSGENERAHLTFFGGETLLNFPVLQKTLVYARERARALGKQVDFSLTTNATLLRPEVIEFLAENDVAVTVSIDGPREMQDRFRVFSNGNSSYDVVLPKVRELLRRHRGKPIGARVTLTSQTLDVRRIFQHLTQEVGFGEVGFAPVTTAPGRAYAIGESGFDQMLAQFRELAHEFLASAVQDRPHGFSNVKDTLLEIHKGVSKAYPCGAGLGLMGVATDGEVALCHRFAGSGSHSLGSVREGVDRSAQAAFLERHHVDEKTDCSRCWARPLCAGGCYHEAYTRYADTARPNLHYCEWIRGWTETCLEIYGELSVRNPAFLARFEAEARTQV